MLRPYRGRRPTVAESAYIDPSAQLIGDVVVGERAGVWANATVRADVASIRIGAESNIQDNACLHVDGDAPLEIGERVVIGHSATVHGCTVGDESLIGIGATILSKARIGAGSIVGAGALVLTGREFPANSLILGAPAERKRETSEKERAGVRDNAARYVLLGREYLEDC